MNHPTPRGHTLTRLIRFVLLIGLSAALGMLVTTWLFYDKPSKDLFTKLTRAVRYRTTTVTSSKDLKQIWVSEDPVKVQVHATGLDMPVRIVFPPQPPQSDDDPFYYVGELVGAIKYITRTGASHTIVDGLLNYQRTPRAELGMLGMDYDPKDRQFFITLTYWDDQNGVYHNRIERLALAEDGRSVADRHVLLDMAPEPTVASYQVQFIKLGPDDLLYVGVGTGGNKADPQNLDKFAGKILRMHKDGSPVDTNPFYDPYEGRIPRQYIYAFGCRNPFDIVFDPRNRIPYVSDVGPGIDRILRLEAGVNYCFGFGGEDQMRSNALYTWGPGGSFAPVGVTIAPASLLGVGEEYQLFVGLHGMVHDRGPSTGKRICRWELGDNGYLRSGVRNLTLYQGAHFASIVDVEAGPDGIYFTDLYAESPEPHAHAGTVYRIVRDESAVVKRPTLDDLAGLTGPELGEQLYNYYGCYQCHTLFDEDPVKEGPSLQNLRKRLDARLASKDYQNHIQDLFQREGAYFRKYQQAYQDMMTLKKTDRVRAWFRYHVADPRFDHLEGKMPSFSMPPEHVEALADYLLQ